MRQNDLTFALFLTNYEKWSDIAFDFETLISYPKQAAFILEADGKRVGMIGTVSYEHMGFIGSFIVHPNYRGQGYGTALFDHGIDHLKKMGTELILLDAVEEAQSFYENKGFKTLFTSHRFRGTLRGKNSDYCRVMKKADFKDVVSVDSECFGEDRSHFLKSLLTNHPFHARILESSEGNIIGFAFASERSEFFRIGPMNILSRTNLARDLVLSIPLPNHEIEVRIGVPGYNEEALSMYRDLGIPESICSIRMGLGNLESMRMHKGQYAIGSPAKG